MAQSPIVVIAIDELEKSITIAMCDDRRIEYFLDSRYYWVRDKLDRWIKEEWFNYAVSALTKNAHRIEIHRPVSGEFEPALKEYGGAVTSRWTSRETMGHSCSSPSSVELWKMLRAKGKTLEEIGRIQYGVYNWASVDYAATEERIMAARKGNNGGDHKSTPDSTYRFTVIAPQAQSFHYHQQRRWYKSEADAKENVASVLESTNNDIELAVVECKDVFKRKPKVELTSTFKKSRR